MRLMRASLIAIISACMLGAAAAVHIRWLESLGVDLALDHGFGLDLEDVEGQVKE